MSARDDGGRVRARGGAPRRPDDLERPLAVGRPRRVRRDPRPERRRQVDADQGRARPAPARGRDAPRCSAGRRARPTTGSATCRSGGTSTRAPASAASTSSGSGSTAPAGAFPLPGLPSRAREAARVAEVLELVDATGYARKPIGELSGGEQQRLLIAQALVRRPELLLLDEPLDSLDLPNQAAVAALVRRICREENVAVLLVAHDINPILSYLDRVVYIAGGSAVEGPAGGGDLERDAEPPLRRADRGAARVRRQARRRRPARGAVRPRRPPRAWLRPRSSRASPGTRSATSSSSSRSRSWSTRSRRGRSSP